MYRFNRGCYYRHTLATIHHKTMHQNNLIAVHLEVDASGLNCPLPLLRLKKALMAINSGEVVKMIATDPAAHLDFGVYIEQTGHALIELHRIDNKQTFYIQKK